MYCGRVFGVDNNIIIILSSSLPCSGLREGLQEGLLEGSVLVWTEGMMRTPIEIIIKFYTGHNNSIFKYL